MYFDRESFWASCWRRPGDEILWILLISLHKSKQHRRCADAFKLEGKKVLKRAADMDGLDSSSQNSRKFVVTAPLRDPSPRLRVVLGARRGGRKSLPGYCPISFSSHLLPLSLRSCFFRLSHFTCYHCSHDRGNEKRRIHEFLGCDSTIWSMGGSVVKIIVFITIYKHGLESSCSFFLFEAGCTSWSAQQALASVRASRQEKEK